MSEIVQVTEAEVEFVGPMTLEEARETHRLIRESEAVKRIRVYLMWRRDGYKKMGFPDFKSYCEQGIDVPEKTAHTWLTQVETTLHARGWKVGDLGSQLENFEIENRLISAPYAWALHKLPEARLRKKAWEQITTIRDMATRTSAQQLSELKRIVTRIRAEEGLDPAPAPKASAPPPGPSKFDQALLAGKLARQEVAEEAQEEVLPEETPEVQQAELFAEAEADPQEEPQEVPDPSPLPAPSRFILEAEAVLYSEVDASLIVRSSLPDGTPVSVMVPLAMLPEEFTREEE